MENRGRLDFSNLDNLADNEELIKLKKQWEAFAANETDKREKYLRELEIQFSLNEIANTDGNKTVSEATATVFSENKLSQRNSR